MRTISSEKTIEIDLGRITFQDRLLLVEIDLKQELSLVMVKESYALIAEILNKRTVVLLTDMRSVELTHYPTDVMRYVSDNEYVQYQKANAILIRGLAQRLIANFYLRVFKPKTPTRVFTDYNEAQAWLKPFSDLITM
jgi:hypothetical protein